MDQPNITRIAMWSGPRNISTALMRSFENRDDTFVTDEPLYSHYLKATGLNHPRRDDIMAAHETDWEKVVQWITGPIPGGKTIWYQKHMAHHLLPTIDRAWLADMKHCFLIRDPREVILSFSKKYSDVTPEALAYPQQAEIFDYLASKTGQTPAVIDTRDVLENPAGMLKTLCNHLDIPFSETMLNWPSGPRDTDGVWGPHWYDAVYQSTGFAPYRPKDEQLPPHLEEVRESCRGHYDKLWRERLTVNNFPHEHQHSLPHARSRTAT